VLFCAILCTSSASASLRRLGDARVSHFNVHRCVAWLDVRLPGWYYAAAWAVLAGIVLLSISVRKLVSVTGVTAMVTGLGIATLWC